MKIEQGLIQRAEQRMLLLPKMLQSIEVLQLGNLELSALVEKTLSENETLKLREETAENAPKEYMERPNMRRVSQEAADRYQEWLSNAPDRPKTLAQHLTDQVALLELPEPTRELVDYVIGNLDANGYLPVSMEQLAQDAPFAANAEQITQAIHIVQHLDPKGIGGRGPLECLLLQLDEQDPDHIILKRIILDFLEDLSKNRLPKVAKALGIEIEELKAMLDKFKQLNPRPAADFAAEIVPNIRPEVVVEQRDNRYEIRVEDSHLPWLELDQNYVELAKNKETPNEVREYLREKIDSGRWLLEAIEQRRLTLLRVARAVFRHQSAFLKHGKKAIRPLMMKDVADEVGVHISTVSRAVADKYVQTPVGIYPLRLFFAGATEGEADTSRVGVREMVRDMVAAEDHNAPLSDEELVTKLKVRGIEVARRTIAKYRTELNIPSSWRRKQY